MIELIGLGCLAVICFAALFVSLDSLGSSQLKVLNPKDPPADQDNND